MTDIELKPETSISAQSSSEPPEKKKISTQEASHAEEDKYVVSKTQGHTTESQSSRLNKIYELSLLDEKYVLFCALSETQFSIVYGQTVPMC